MSGLDRSSARAEVPLLPNDVAERLTAIRRPAHDVFLRPLDVGLRETEPDAFDGLRIREEQPNRLLSRRLGLPSATLNQGGLDRMRRVVRRDLDLCELFQVQPILVRRHGTLSRCNDSFAHVVTSDCR
jgi:hypothetical protein